MAIGVNVLNNSETYAWHTCIPWTCSDSLTQMPSSVPSGLLFDNSSWHGRNSQGLDELLQKPGTLLGEFRNNIYVTEDPATAGISSTHIRHELGQVSIDPAGCRSCGCITSKALIEYEDLVS